MLETITELIALLPGKLAIELTLLAIGTGILLLLIPIVRTTLDDDPPFPSVARYVKLAFGAGIPIALVLWFLSILVRYW